MKELTHSRLRELLHYEPSTGIFIWLRKTSANSHVKAGTTAGWADNGYTKVTVEGRDYKAHRLAWFYVHGKWPTCHIDHINRARSDNRIENLRDVTYAVNSQNRSRPMRNNKSSGFLGVTKHVNGKWSASIRVRGKPIFGGLHTTPELAHEAYLALKIKMHPGYVP